MPDSTVTTNEILEFLQEHMVTKEEFDIYKQENKQEMNGIRQDMNRMKLDIIDHFDAKLADVRADLILLIRKGDTKFVSLVNVLSKNNLVEKSDIQQILALEPFPR